MTTVGRNVLGRFVVEAAEVRTDFEGRGSGCTEGFIEGWSSAAADGTGIGEKN